MKEYLYIPLGGNRISTKRTYFNLTVVFLISGLWHGASWTFVLWGLFHGLFLIFDRLFMLNLLKKAGRFPSILLTFLVVVLGWVLFRAETVSAAVGYYKALFAFRCGLTTVLTPQFILFFALAVVFSFLPILKIGDRWMERIFGGVYSKRMAVGLFFIAIMLFFLSAGTLAVTDFNPFIYFRF